MSKKLSRASAIAVAAMIGTIVFSANGSGAFAQNVVADQTAQTVNQPLLQIPQQPGVETTPQASDTVTPDLDVAPLKAASLAQLVSEQPQPAELSRELNCLAGAIYFEAKSESLNGQLAVGRVIVARSKSGRFPNSYCGVVFQPSQFSFVRGGGMPGIAKGSRQWKNAVAIAQIAHAGSWHSPVEGALYFHAAYVSPGWHMKRMGRIENHVFYR
jgi:spore germination cell wall hydrolase CwlJ-like protein